MGVTTPISVPTIPFPVICLATLEREEARSPACWARFRDLMHAAQDGWADPDPRPGPDPVQAVEVVNDTAIALPPLVPMTIT